MKTVTSEIRVQATPAEVWQVLTDHEGYPRWAGVSSMEVVGEERGLGARRLASLGRLTLHQVIEEFEPEKTFTYAIDNAGPFSRSVSRWTLEEDEEGTQIRNEASFSLKLGLPAFLLAWKVRSGQRTALEGLRRVLDRSADR